MIVDGRMGGGYGEACESSDYFDMDMCVDTGRAGCVGVSIVLFIDQVCSTRLFILKSSAYFPLLSHVSRMMLL